MGVGWRCCVVLEEGRFSCFWKRDGVCGAHLVPPACCWKRGEDLRSVLSPAGGRFPAHPAAGPPALTTTTSRPSTARAFTAPRRRRRPRGAEGCKKGRLVGSVPWEEGGNGGPTILAAARADTALGARDHEAMPRGRAPRGNSKRPRALEACLKTTQERGRGAGALEGVGFQTCAFNHRQLSNGTPGKEFALKTSIHLWSFIWLWSSWGLGVSRWQT